MYRVLWIISLYKIIFQIFVCTVGKRPDNIRAQNNFVSWPTQTNAHSIISNVIWIALVRNGKEKFVAHKIESDHAIHAQNRIEPKKKKQFSFFKNLTKFCWKETKTTSRMKRAEWNQSIAPHTVWIVLINLIHNSQ